MDKILSAILLPAIMMIFFTRVTYRKTVGFILTLALIVVSAYKGFLDSWWLILIEAASLTFGLYLTNHMFKRKGSRASS